ncbi:MAG: DUF2231 domain-containing protein [Armatimonadota bacterium]
MPFLFHSPVVHFPVALWLTSALFDILYLGTADQFHGRAAQFLIGLGLLGAVVAIVTGFIDYRPLVAEGIGDAFIARHRVHAVFAYASTVAYLVSFLLRWRRPLLGRAVTAVLLVVGAALIGITGYIGGEVRGAM